MRVIETFSFFFDKLSEKNSPVCCKLISYNLKIAATGPFNTFLLLLSLHFKHENLRRELKTFFFLPGVLVFTSFLESFLS